VNSASVGLYNKCGNMHGATLKITPTCFGPHLQPSSGGPWAVFYTVTKLKMIVNMDRNM